MHFLPRISDSFHLLWENTTILQKATVVIGVSILVALWIRVFHAKNQNLAPETKALSERKIIVLTDLEPDDRKALDVLGSVFSEKNILFVGTTVMHAGRKKALVRKNLDQLGLSQVKVYQGKGGTAETYDPVNSTKAAKSYDREGRGILSDQELESINKTPHSSDELEKQIRKTLETEQNKSIEIALLAPPSDLVKVLNDSPHLKHKIKHIHVMGGWTEIREKTEVVCRTSYNWDMDPQASAQLMQMKNIPMTLYSSHMLKNNFSGGSINAKTFPKLIERIEKYRLQLPHLEDATKAGRSWNHHVMNTIPILKDVIEPYADHQFTPADPAVAVGMINASFILKKKRVRISIDPCERNERGSRVKIEDDSSSQITQVEEVSLKIFEEEMLATYDRLIKRSSKK